MPVVTQGSKCALTATPEETDMFPHWWTILFLQKALNSVHEESQGTITSTASHKSKIVLMLVTFALELPHFMRNVMTE